MKKEKKQKTVADYMEELDRLEAAGELEVDEELFHGHTLNLAAWNRYQEIRSELDELLEIGQSVLATRSSGSPDPTMEGNHITLSLSKLTMFSREETAILTAALAKADQISILTFEDETFLNVHVDGIWIN